MKQFKLWMVALTVLMGVSLTSCLNSESDPYRYGNGFAKAYGTCFKSGDITITPSTRSVTSLLAAGVDISKMSGKVVYIGYRWDPTQVEIPSDTKDIRGVDLQTVLNVDNTVEIVEEKGAPNDSINKAPIISLSFPNNSDVKPAFYDETTLMLPVNYYMYGKVHYLTLKYYPNKGDDKTLKLYLHHNNKDDESTNTTSYNYLEQGYLPFFYKTYDLSEVFSRYMRDNNISDRPTTVEVIATVNQHSIKMDDALTEEKIYTITKADKE